MQPTAYTTTLPPHFTTSRAVDLGKNKGLKIGLSVLATVLTLPVGYGLIVLIDALRGDAVWRADVIESAADGIVINFPLEFLIGGLIATVLVVPLHEAIHGAFFWLYTRQRPRFGYKLIYAFAAPPDGVYMRRWPYIIVGLAPLVLIGALGSVAAARAPATLVPTLFLLMMLNTVGAVGDVVVVAWILTIRREILVQDSGDAIRIYRAP